ncbi:MAG: hypothetical protein DWQ05_08415 [Calditrichaeota bacterium]|nr:MAG: hypothetical protein DWQ05_08415 [Calditrichota bacterium]
MKFVKQRNSLETVENPENLDPELVEGPKFGGNAGRFDKLSDRFSHFFDSLVRISNPDRVSS